MPRLYSRVERATQQLVYVDNGMPGRTRCSEREFPMRSPTLVLDYELIIHAYDDGYISLELDITDDYSLLSFTGKCLLEDLAGRQAQVRM